MSRTVAATTHRAGLEGGTDVRRRVARLAAITYWPRGSSVSRSPPPGPTH